MSFSQDSTTTYSPATHRPNTSRSSAQVTGLTHTTCRIAALDAVEARAANTRMWPTAAKKRTATAVPNRKPTK